MLLNRIMMATADAHLVVTIMFRAFQAWFHLHNHNYSHFTDEEIKVQ